MPYIDRCLDRNVAKTDGKKRKKEGGKCASILKVRKKCSSWVKLLKVFAVSR